MRLKSGTIAAVALAIAAPAAPAAAQAVGTQVVDTKGAPVGTVTAIKGDNLLIKTDKHEALLPKSSFTAVNGKLLFAMTQAELDSQIEASAAASQAAIVAGATVKGQSGTEIGKIDSVDNGQVILTLTSGKRLQVPISGFRGNADGTVTIGYTADQIEALVNGGASSGTAGK